jgi:HPt (histidine-containing phosphotransfer) domain-containing protein
MSVRLDAVAKAKSAYVTARLGLEHELREKMRSDLSNLNTQIDIAVRLATDAGESKAAILRALGTKDYGTINASLQRTQGVADIVGVNELDQVYSTVDDVLTVQYISHGSKNLTGKAAFSFSWFDPERLFLQGRDSLWNHTFTVRNDVIANLDGVMQGEYYEEVKAWLKEKENK